MYESTAPRKQAEYKFRLVLIAQFQVFHDVREINVLSTATGEDCIDEFRSQFFEIGRNGARWG